MHDLSISLISTERRREREPIIIPFHQISAVNESPAGIRRQINKKEARDGTGAELHYRTLNPEMVPSGHFQFGAYHFM